MGPEPVVPPAPPLTRAGHPGPALVGRLLLGGVERGGRSRAVAIDGDRHRIGQAEVLAVEVGERHVQPVGHERQQVGPHCGHRRRAGGQQRLVAGQERGLDVDHVLAEHGRAAGDIVGRRDQRLAHLGSVQVSLRHAEGVVDQRHLVVLRDQGDRRRWFLAEDSSFRACEVPGVAAWDRSGASNGVQPSVGSRNSSSSALSLPLMPWSRRPGAVLAALNCAVWPFGGHQVDRGDVVTRILVDHVEVAGGRAGQRRSWVTCRRPGRDSLPSRSARNAAWKKLIPLQNDTWPKIDPGSPFTQWPWGSASGVAPTWVRSVPLKPTSIVTTACRGSVGSTGAAAGLGALGDHQRLVHASRPFPGSGSWPARTRPGWRRWPWCSRRRPATSRPAR